MIPWHISSCRLYLLEGALMSINDPIAYSWTLGWDPAGMLIPRPIVNPLLKAIIERDYEAMDSLCKRGARLSSVNDTTFRRVLYHVAGDYRTVKWLIDHGMYGDSEVGYAKEGVDGNECTDPSGYTWGLLPRAWYLWSYESMELLAARGFDYMTICAGGKSCSLDDAICFADDVRAMRIMREHGYLVRPWQPSADANYKRLSGRYPNSDVVRDIKENPLVTRKSIGLDSSRCNAGRHSRFAPLPEPVLVQAHNDGQRRRNELEQADHKDWLRAQEEYAAKWAPEGRVRTKLEQDRDDAEFEAALIAVANSLEREKRGQR